jgi:hypothetical protein
MLVVEACRGATAYHGDLSQFTGSRDERQHAAMDKKRLQRLTLERLTAYRKYHAKGGGACHQHCSLSLRSAMSMSMPRYGLWARSYF